MSAVRESPTTAVTKRAALRPGARGYTPYLLLAPALLLLLALIIYPLVDSLRLSFTDYNFALPITRFVGMSNYVTALTDRAFYHSLRITITYASASTAACLVLGLATATLLNRQFPLKRLVTTLLLLPMTVTPVVSGMLWTLLYQPDFSVYNYFLSLVGLKPLPWLTNPQAALLAVIIVDVWQWTPFFTLILLSGLTSLPEEPYEAAKMDGASSLKAFYYITLPLLKPAILVAVLLRLIDAFRSFDTVFVMTNGGPGNATELLSLHIYRTGFINKFMGEAAALGYLFLIILTIIVTYLIKFMRRSETQGPAHS